MYSYILLNFYLVINNIINIIDIIKCYSIQLNQFTYIVNIDNYTHFYF